MKENQIRCITSEVKTRKSMENDVRALINHDSTLVLGRTKDHTLEIREVSNGFRQRPRSIRTS